jgi:hypothetical protein
MAELRRPTCRHPGRIKRRLAELLQKRGYRVTEYDLHREYEDVYWTAREPDLKVAGKLISFGRELIGWSTMTDCVRFGLSIGPDDDVPLTSASCLNVACRGPAPGRKLGWGRRTAV